MGCTNDKTKITPNKPVQEPEAPMDLSQQMKSTQPTAPNSVSRVLKGKITKKNSREVSNSDIPS